MLSPRCRTSPCCCSSASASTCGAIEPGSAVLEAADPEVDHVHRLEAEPLQVVVDLLLQLARVRAPAGQPPSASRRAPTLVTMCRSAGYGASASRMISLVTNGP